MSNTANHGGPAFPCATGSDGGIFQSGASLLAYFMVHAPAEPQGWFVPKIGIERPVWVTLASDEEQKAYFQADNAYQSELHKQRYLQWPRAWAEEMLKQLGDKGE